MFTLLICNLSFIPHRFEVAVALDIQFLSLFESLEYI